MKSAHEHLTISTQELEAVLERARQHPLDADDYEKLKAAIRTLGYVTELLENREATLETLRRLLCQSSTEKTRCSSAPALRSRRKITSALGSQHLLDTGATAPAPMKELREFTFRMRA